MTDTEPAEQPWRQTIESLYTTHRSDLVGFADNLLSDHDWAQDICQQVFFKLLTRDTPPDSLSYGYLLRAIRNEVIDQLRRVSAQKIDRVANIDLAIEPLQDDAEDHCSQLLADWKASLSKKQQAVIELWSRELPYDEIAAQLGMAVKTAQEHAYQAKKKLRQLAAERERERESKTCARWSLAATRSIGVYSSSAEN